MCNVHVYLPIYSLNQENCTYIGKKSIENVETNGAANGAASSLPSLCR